MKLRQPPYGKRIFEARQRGDHPLGAQLHVHFGGPPSVALGRLSGIWVPADVALATLDWRVAAGLCVILWDGRSRARQADKTLLLEIAGEIADYAPWIWVVSLRMGGELSELAKRAAGPLPWWPDERGQRYIERHAAWRAAFWARADRAASVRQGDGEQLGTRAAPQSQPDHTAEPR